MDLSIADAMLSSFDRDGCLAAARSCVAGSRRFGLATEPVAHLWLAGAHALAGDDAAMEDSIASALARDPGDPRILGDLYGRVLPTRSFVADDLGALPRLLDTMMEFVGAAPPTTSIFPGRILWATLHAISDDDLGAGAIREFTEVVRRLPLPVFTDALNTVEAITLGRRGDVDAATERMRTARDSFARLETSLGLLHSQRMLVALEANRAGWGDPVTWLREAEAFFSAGGYPSTARRCRTMLGEVGAPVPRPGRSAVDVPQALRAMGVTSREAEVLKLIAAQFSNRQIGDRLFLSPKTVERHVSNLFGKTKVRNRGELAKVARANGLIDG
jgi:DNA-binding CsgD family transcriptional regulator